MCLVRSCISKSLRQKPFNHFQTNTLFEQELATMNVTKPFSRFAPETYDAVWSIALALKGAEELWRNESRLYKRRRKKKLELFDYTRKDLATNFLEQFSRLKFQGISVKLQQFNVERDVNICFFLSLLSLHRATFRLMAQTASASQHFIKSNSPNCNLLLYTTLRLNF